METSIISTTILLQTTDAYTHIPTHIYTDFLAVKTDHYLSFSKLRYDSQHGKAFFNSSHDGDSRAATFCCHIIINKKLFCNFHYSLSHKMPQFGQIRWYMRPNDCVGYLGHTCSVMEIRMQKQCNCHLNCRGILFNFPKVTNLSS